MQRTLLILSETGVTARSNLSEKNIELPKNSGRQKKIPTVLQNLPEKYA